MDSAKIRNWLEIVGIFGVIASLIFVGLEMRQSQQIAIATINAQKTDTGVQIVMAAASNPVVLSAMEKVESDKSNALTLAERRAIRLLLAADWMRFSDTYWQNVNGFVPEHRWLAMRARVKGDLSNNPLYREFVENDKGISAPMRQVVEEILSEIDAGI